MTILATKTWVDLLGRNTANCLVDGKHIVRQMGASHYHRLWSFESHYEALDAMQEWLDQAERRRGELVCCPACTRLWDPTVIPPPRVPLDIRCACCCQ
jgi:hypothetical protein